MDSEGILIDAEIINFHSLDTQICNIKRRCQKKVKGVIKLGGIISLISWAYQ